MSTEKLNRRDIDRLAEHGKDEGQDKRCLRWSIPA